MNEPIQIKTTKHNVTLTETTPVLIKCSKEISDDIEKAMSLGVIQAELITCFCGICNTDDPSVDRNSFLKLSIAQGQFSEIEHMRAKFNLLNYRIEPTPNNISFCLYHHSVEPFFESWTRTPLRIMAFPDCHYSDGLIFIPTQFARTADNVEYALYFGSDVLHGTSQAKAIQLFYKNWFC